MKRKKLIIGIVLFGLPITALLLWKSFSASEKITAQPNGAWVSVSAVGAMDLPLVIETIGSLNAKRIEVTPEVAGHVSNMNFQDGSLVNKGTVLVQLDDEIYRSKYHLAQAKLTLSRTNYQRMLLLNKQGAITKQALDQSRADLAEKEADALESHVMFKKMQMTAPFSGKVGKSKVNIGDYVTVGQSVVTLTDTDHLRVEYHVPERYLPTLKLGQQVEIHTNAYPDAVFRGKVTYIAPSIDIENRSIALYAELTDDQYRLVPGMFVEVKHLLGSAEHALVIPARALVPTLGGNQVYKVIEGKAYSVSVTLGIRKGNDVQIITGLSLGDQIITDGFLKVRDGLPIQIKA